jgi:hypothetical protein
MNDKRPKNKFHFIAFSSILLFSFVSMAASQSNDKLTVEQLVAKHLESIGTTEARSAVKSITSVGSAEASFKGRGEGKAEGIIVIASQGERNMIGMKFNNSAYPYEKLGFDGSDFAVGFVRPGEYTILGQFLRVNAKTFKSGILGGTMSTSWELLKSDFGGGKLRAKGKTKIDGVEVLKYSYSPRSGSDLNIMFYFDAISYRHVRTEYSRVISAAQGPTIDTSSRQSETRYKMVEDFSDFRESNKLILPHSYKLFLEILTGNGTTSYTWNIVLQEYRFNQELAASEFNVNTD